MADDFDVIVDTDACGLPFGVFIAALRQRTQCRAIHLDEGAVAAAGQFFEGAPVQGFQQLCHRTIGLGEAEETLVAQSRVNNTGYQLDG